MKRSILILILLFISNVAFSQTMVIKNIDGQLVGNKLNQIAKFFFIDETVLDVEGNEYKIIIIGKQIWMAENLKVTKYRNGNDITDVWAYNNNENNVSDYGRLYSWHEVNKHVTESDSGYCIAPEGWHIPTHAEWEELAQYISDDNGGYSMSLGDWSDVGTHLKSNSGWNSDGNGTDDYGFTGLPAGDRGSNGIFYNIENIASFWSASQISADVALCRRLYYNMSRFDLEYAPKETGCSVRCVRD